MIDHRLAFFGAVAHEIHGRAVEPLTIGVGRDDIGPHFAQGLQRAIVDRGVDFHTARVVMGTKRALSGISSS